MGTHPIFESDFDCLTEMIAGVVKCVPAPSVNSIVKNTAICVVLCGGGDVLAQVFLHGGNLEKLKTGYDTRRTFHYAISGAFMRPWFAWWFPFLARHYASVWTLLGLELLTTPFLPAGIYQTIFVNAAYVLLV